MSKISRRTLLLGLTGSVGATLLGCGGSSPGGNTEVPDPAQFAATLDGSILENTEAYFGVDIRHDPEIDEDKVVLIRRNGRTLLAGENLVFEVNGQRRDTGGDSVRKTHVRKGDTITWKDVS